ncbi:glycosyltransferase 87 family protein [Streptomyces sp. WAC06614]|uniref:glycosyltransferase 87 family protein n=1 Tax=Streptomyces sp. WAC06614 TaxID=2487416 RepID=UPI00163BD1B3|nr:glycosyltransferase 87 family protein [Streptomyces sp. WAC06614]
MDIRVYYDAAPGLLSGHLYDIRSGPGSLLFTYPPFAALVMLPLSWLPWAVAVVLVQLLNLIALAVIIDRAAVLLQGARMGRRSLMLWVALAFWTEPVHHTFDLGQVNLGLAAVAISAAALPAARSALAGSGVGLIAGWKLVPAVTGLYFLALGRRKAAVWSLVAFLVTVAVGWSIAPRESIRYWTSLLWDSSRVGSVMSVRNQSLQGVIARFAGHDVGRGLWWGVCAVLVIGLACLAASRAARRGDRLGVLLVVQLAGLMLVPISWSHHWVWCVPALMWLAAPKNRALLSARVAFVAWVLVTGTHVVPTLSTMQDSLAPGSPYPGVLAWLGTAFCVCGVATLVAVLRANRRSSGTSLTVRPAVSVSDSLVKAG